jgi:hypothetical protein
MGRTDGRPAGTTPVWLKLVRFRAKDWEKLDRVKDVKEYWMPTLACMHTALSVRTLQWEAFE